MISEQHISTYARQLRENMQLDAMSPIGRLDTLIREAEFNLLEEGFGDEFSGFSRWIGPMQFLIGFNTDHYWSKGFRRFTLSHELAHLTIPHHVEMLERVGTHYSRPEFQSKDDVEREADRFAINFLAPRSAAALQTKGHDYTCSGVRHLADYFGLSLYAAALRFVETTDLACALVVCNSSGEIDYERRSPTLKSVLRHSFIHKNAVSQYTLAADYLEGKRDENDVDTNLREWYPDLEEDVEAKESVLFLGHNRKYLVMLTPYSLDFES